MQPEAISDAPPSTLPSLETSQEPHPNINSLGTLPGSSQNDIAASILVGIICCLATRTMDDFNSETDSDYTSYWRDWVSFNISSCPPCGASLFLLEDEIRYRMRQRRRMDALRRYIFYLLGIPIWSARPPLPYPQWTAFP